MVIPMDLWLGIVMDSKWDVMNANMMAYLMGQRFVWVLKRDMLTANKMAYLMERRFVWVSGWDNKMVKISEYCLLAYWDLLKAY